MGRNYCVTSWLSLGVILCALGCQQQEAIRTYRVAKADREPRKVSSSAEATAGRDARIFSAMVPRGDSYWVFHLLDSPEVVEKNQADFQRMVESLTFRGNEPDWELQEGWESKRSNGIIYAELLKESDGVRATVSVFPMGDTWQDTVVLNVARWQRKLSLQPETDWEQVAKNLREVEGLGESDSPAYYVSLRGKEAAAGGPFQGMMGAPPSAAPASASGGAAAAPTPSEAMPDDPLASLTYTPPAGWTESSPASSIVKAAFAIEDSDGKAEVKISTASVAVENTVGMWLQQVGLPAEAAQVESVLGEATEIKVNGKEARVFHLDGSTAADAQSIYVAAVELEGESLFVKLSGDATVVDAQHDAFLEFLTTIRW